MQERQPLTRKPGQAPDAFKRIRVDTWLGMAFSNLVALAIYHSGNSASHRRCGHRDGRGIASRASSPSPCSPCVSSGRDCCPCQCSQGLPLMRSARLDAGRSGSREGQSTPKHSTPLLRSRCLAARRRQVGDVDGDPPRLVTRQQFRCRSPAGLLLAIKYT